MNAPLPVPKNSLAQFQICNAGDVWVSVDVVTANRFARKSTGALEAMARATHRAESRRAAAEDRRAARSLLMELREGDRRNRALWKRFRVKAPKPIQQALARKAAVRHRPTRSGWLGGTRLLPAYSAPIIDRMGRRGVFFRARYYGKASKAGVGRRATAYIARGAFETEDGRLMFLSNVAEDPHEAMAAMELIEQINRAAQSNGKALFHIIANVPFEMPTDAMFEIGQRFAEQQFGSRDLPFALALHAPSDEGDQRNWHLHILFSTRPMVRTGGHQWDVGEMLRTEIDNADAFRQMRDLYAVVQTEVAQEAGLGFVYTGLSNAARALPIAPQEHLGGDRTDMVRRGLDVPANEHNWEISIAGEAAMLDEKLRHAEEAAAEQASVLARALKGFALRAAAVTVPLTLARSVGTTHAQPVIVVPQAIETVIPGLATARSALLGNLSIANLQPHESLAIAVPLAARRPPDLLAIASSVVPSMNGRAVIEPIKPLHAVLPVAARVDTAATSSVSLRYQSSPVRPAAPPRSLAAPPAAIRIAIDPAVVAKPIWMSHATIRPRAAVLADAPPRPAARVAGPALLRQPIWPSRSIVARRAQSGSVVETPPPMANIEIRPALTEPPVSLVLTATKVAKSLATVPAIPAMVHRAEKEEFGSLFRAADERNRALAKAAEENERKREPATLPDANAAHAAALEALRLRDDWIGQDGHGQFTVADAALGAVGLTHADLRTPAIQVALKKIGTHQLERLDPIDDVTGLGLLRSESGAIALDARFSKALRENVARWGRDARFVTFVETAWPHVRADRQPPLVQETPPIDATAQTGSKSTVDPWMLAASVRQRAMAQWDAIERYDADLSRRPGRVLARPGKSAPLEGDAAKSIEPPRIRFHPGLFPGGGIGG